MLTDTQNRTDGPGGLAVSYPTQNLALTRAKPGNGLVRVGSRLEDLARSLLRVRRQQVNVRQQSCAADLPLREPTHPAHAEVEVQTGARVQSHTDAGFVAESRLFFPEVGRACSNVRGLVVDERFAVQLEKVDDGVS